MSPIQQRQTWGCKAPGFSWATSGWARCIIVTRATDSARAQPSPPLIPTLIDLWVIDFVLSPVWWEAVTSSGHRWAGSECSIYFTYILHSVYPSALLSNTFNSDPSFVVGVAHWESFRLRPYFLWLMLATGTLQLLKKGTSRSPHLCSDSLAARTSLWLVMTVLLIAHSYRLCHDLACLPFACSRCQLYPDISRCSKTVGPENSWKYSINCSC